MKGCNIILHTIASFHTSNRTETFSRGLITFRRKEIWDVELLTGPSTNCLFASNALERVLYKTRSNRNAIPTPTAYNVSCVRMNVPKRDIELTGSNFESLARVTRLRFTGKSVQIFKYHLWYYISSKSKLYNEKIWLSRWGCNWTVLVNFNHFQFKFCTYYTFRVACKATRLMIKKE